MLKYEFAEKCAWRAIYISAGCQQIAYLGIDPTASRPNIFGYEME